MKISNPAFFLGIVESIDDEDKLGRVKVRLLQGQDPNNTGIGTDDLILAYPLMPVHGGTHVGIGVSPVGQLLGSTVVGLYIPGSSPGRGAGAWILGSWPIIQSGDHAVSSYARGQGPVQKEYVEGVEPRSQYAAEYPYNKTITTRNGHVIELDDTPGKGRIHVYHNSGSYIEMNPDGSIVTKAMGDDLSVTMNNKSVVAMTGDIKIIASDGEITIISEKDINVQSNNGTIRVLAPMVEINA